MGLVTQHESTNGRCSLCGRQSKSVTTEELGNWVVQDGGTLVCSVCAKDSDKAVAGPEAFSGPERVEKVPAGTPQPPK